MSRRTICVIALLLIGIIFSAVAFVTQGAVTINSPYEGVNWTTYGQHKADFHIHTTQSDGSLTPAAMIDEYANRGFDVLAITDHNKVTWPWTTYGRDPAALGMLAIQGVEASNTHHTGCYFSGYTGRDPTSDAVLAAVAANNGLSIFCHPGRHSYSTEWYTDHFQANSHLVGMEVHNHPDDREKWDDVLTEIMPNRPVWGYSNSDAHHTSNIGQNTNFLLLPELTETAVRNAMVGGQLYFSYTPTQDAVPPTISSIDVNQSAATISITGSDFNEVRWISEGTQVATGTTFDPATSMPGVKYSYVRAELHSPTGITYTQPFGIVPEPSSVLLLVLSVSLLVLGGLSLLIWRRRK